MKALQLTKQSNENELKNYFKSVLKLAKTNEEFPVNLDDVWPLVYARKDKAVEALKSNFIDLVDYKLLPQKVEQVTGAKYVDCYKITVPCMEFFIARKVRPVFEVYRQIFHRTIEQAQLTCYDPTVVKSKLIVADWAAKFLNLNQSSKLLIVKSIADPLGLPTPDYTISKGQLLPASVLLKQNNINISAQEFNKMMIEAEYMSELERPSRGGIKRFKSLTEKANEYGENQVNPDNPKQTQPLYYVDKFLELLSLLKPNKES